MTINVEQNNDDAVINRIERQAKLKSQLFVTLSASAKDIRFQVDTGAMSYVVRREDLPDNVDIQPTSQVLSMFNRQRVTPAGKCELKLRHPRTGKKYVGQFIVVSESPTSILGARSSVQMGLVTVDEQSVMKMDQSTLQMEDILREYPEVFNGEFGCFAGELHLELDPTVIPIQLPVRKTPLALKDRLKDELDRLEGIGVI